VNLSVTLRQACLLLPLGVGGLLVACRPDQVEHLKDSKRIGIETANWEVKRIMPADLLHATRWAGDSLTATADTLLRRTLAHELAAGGLMQAARFCRPEKYRLVDSLARVMQAQARRQALPPTPPDTARRLTRPSQEQFDYRRAIVVNSSLCIRCHRQGSADHQALLKTYPQLPAGASLGQTLGQWQVSFRRPGVAEFYTMKTRKKWKPHKF
jgi:hypothetical protein